MISRIRLENFRSHALTEIAIAAGEQIIAVAGQNGAGKSTVLEGLMYALFGVSRNGSKRLDHLVRRGAEHDGMTVEVDFVVSDVTYTVARRRGNGTTSAVLYVDGAPLVDGVAAVNAAIVNLLGTDAAGFKLASVAQQKELDALVRLASKPRVQAVHRLLRIDAVTRAREAAHKAYNSSRTSLEALGQPESSDDLAAATAAAEQQHLESAAAESAVRAEIGRLEGQIRAAADIVDVYQQARDRRSAAEAAVRSADRHVAEATAARQQVLIPDAPQVPAVDVDALAEQASDARNRLTLAEAAEQSRNDRRIVEQELASLQAERSALVEAVAGGTDPLSAAVDAAEQHLAGINSRLSALRKDVADASASVAAAHQEESSLTRRLDAIRELDDSCYACAQQISHDHRSGMIADVEQDLADARRAAAERQREQSELERQIADVETARVAAEQQVADTSQALSAMFAATGDLAQVEQRISVYEDRIGRYSDVAAVGDVDASRHAVEQAEQILRDARAVRDAQHAHDTARQLADERQSVLDRAVSDLAAARAELAASAIPDGLQANWDQYQQAVEQRSKELEMLTVLSSATAQARAAVDASKSAEQRNAEHIARRDEWRRKGTVASYAKEILARLEAHAGQNARPSIEAVASTLLASMTGGRFTALRLEADFEPLVFDDGDYRPVSELSGGEQDLVALAVRLALAEVVGERSGNDTGGFLILDEVLGSLDASRRDATLSTLQGLRGRYGQVWSISHVGGVDEFADRVLDVERDLTGIATVT